MQILILNKNVNFLLLFPLKEPSVGNVGLISARLRQAPHGLGDSEISHKQNRVLTLLLGYRYQPATDLGAART